MTASPCSDAARDVTAVEAAAAALAPSLDELLAACGYRRDTPPAWDRNIAADMISLAVARSRPLAGYRRCTLLIAGDELRIADATLHAGAVIAPMFADCDSVAVFAASIGEGAERRAREYMDAGDGLRGYLLDGIASHMAEALAEQVSRAVEDAERLRGRSCTRRISPGYCGWSVADQHALFSLLPPAFCGITLTASAFMHPVKSISGLIGVKALAT